MAEGKLYIGTRQYSSWSLRGWLPVRLAKLDVEEIVIPLAGGATPAVKAVTPGGTVPYLEHRSTKVWESLAICEYCAEFLPALWPNDAVARAHARSIAAEMHAGFAALRSAMPMNLNAEDKVGKGRTQSALANIARIDALWRDTRARFGADGPYLFGVQFI
jgi:glutathione S-transferase